MEDDGKIFIQNSKMIFNTPRGIESVLNFGGKLEVEDSAFFSGEWLDLIITGNGGELHNVTLPGNSVIAQHSHQPGKLKISSSELYRFDAQMPAEVKMFNSTISELLVLTLQYIFYQDVTVNDLHPGMNEVSVFTGTRSLSLSETFVGRWGIHLPGEGGSLKITDCTLDYIMGGELMEGGLGFGRTPVSMSNSTTKTLMFYDYHDGVLTMQDAEVTEVIIIEDSSLELRGTVSLSTVYRVRWVSGSVTRDFPVITEDSSGVPLPNTDLELYSPQNELVWSRKTDSQGTASFEITFDDDNYGETWTLVAPNLGINKEVEFLTDTPIVVESVR